MSKIEDNKFKIETFKDVIASFERSIEKIKELPRTKKREKSIKDLQSRIDYRKDKIREMEIEIEMELKKAELEAREFVKRITDRSEKMGKTLEVKKERGQYFAELLSSGFDGSKIIVELTYLEIDVFPKSYTEQRG